ncbi:MAG TPA: hypothetical protein PLV42_10395 [bacterium]|nr:hypothetical protein [bacterium]
MNDPRDFLVRLVERLEAIGIPFMLSGSIASSYHGRPRATQDIDIIIEADLDKTLELFRSLGPAYYVSELAVREACTFQRSFNIIDMKTGYKADIIIRKKRAFSIEEFSRRLTVRLYDLDLPVVTPEDAILSKLEWSLASGGSERQFNDTLGIMQMQGTVLDRDYLRRWAKELGVGELLERLFAEGGDKG